MNIQYGGRCKLCGSFGTNSSSCPLNPNALNVKPNKHPNASASAAPTPASKTPGGKRTTISRVTGYVGSREEAADQKSYTS